MRDLLTPVEDFCAKNLINKVPSYKVSENPARVQKILFKKILTS